MTGMHMPTPSIDALKAQAKRLRASLKETGKDISHAEALELVARQHGHRDWNTAHAAAGNRPPVAWHVGQVLTGTYLGQRFIGEVLAVQKMGEAGLHRVTLHFDAPVDVVTFDSFSAFRQRVTVTLSADGTTAAKTSNGEPHMRVDL